MTKLILAIAKTITSTFAKVQLTGFEKTILKTYDHKNFEKSFQLWKSPSDSQLSKSRNARLLNSLSKCKV